MKNLRDVISRVFRQHEEVLELVPTPREHFQKLTNRRLDRAVSKERKRAQARELFKSIHALSKKGMKNAQITRELGIHRHTVGKYLAFKAPPVRRNFTKKVCAIAPYEDYILLRWQQGCRNATQIHRQICEQGYPGVYNNVVRITRYLKEQERLGKPVLNRSSGISAGHAAGILVKRPENRSEQEAHTYPIEAEEGPPEHGAMLHIVRGVGRHAQVQANTGAKSRPVHAWRNGRSGQKCAASLI